MLVCPTCRNENQEDAQFCTTCGRSLSPEDAALVAPARREPADLEIDIPPPKRQSPLPGLFALAAVLVAGVGAVTWFALRPNPCAGKFSSERFPYCMVVPRGWQEAQVDVQGSAVDAFTPSDDGPTVFVYAADAPDGLDTEGYTDDLRSEAQDSGLFPTNPRPIEIGGDDALVWELTKSDTTTGSMITERRVTLVRDGTLWQILLFGRERAVDRSEPQFEHMLETWAWQ